MTDLGPTLRDRIKSVIDGALSDYDIETCDIEVAEDWSGDESIFVNITYRLNSLEVDPAQMTEVQSTIWSMLIENGENRFPYFRHHFAEGWGG